MPRTPDIDNARSAVANLSKTRPPDDPEVVEARRRLREAVASKYIQDLVAQAPPLSPEVRQRLAALLRAPSAA